MTWHIGRQRVQTSRIAQWLTTRGVALVATLALGSAGGVLVASPAFAASASASITSAAITRDAATGDAKWDVSVTVSNYWNSAQSGICTASGGCEADLFATYSDNSYSLLDSHSGLYGKTSPDVEHFVGSSPHLKLKSLQAIVVGANGQVSSSVKVVSDPYLKASIGLTITSVGRDPANNQFSWDVTATASNYRLLDGYCPGTSDCELVLQAKSSDGSTSDLDWVTDPAGHNYPYTHHFVGEASLKKVVSLGVYLTGSGGTLQGTFISVSDSVPTPTISMSIKALSAVPSSDPNDPFDDTLSWKVDATADNYSTADFGCPTTGCQVELNMKYLNRRTGATETTTADIGTLPAGGAHTVFHFDNHVPWGDMTDHGTSWVGLPTQWQVVLDNENGKTVATNWSGYAIRTADELAAGGNPSENGCSCSVHDPIDTSTGAFWEDTTDLSLPGVGPDLSAARSYSSSQVGTIGPLGNGWSDALDAHLDISASDVTVYQENGSTVSFSSMNGTAWTAAAGVLATLKTAGSGASQTWTFQRRAGTSFTFNSSGYLTKVTDLHGNVVTITRDGSGNLATATASGGRKLTFTWTNGFISQVDDSAGRTVLYGHDTSGNLTSVQAPDGGITTYAYDSGNRLTDMTRPHGGDTVMTYDSAGRVATQTDPMGRRTTFTYDTYSTTVTEPDGVQNVDFYSGGLPVRRVADAQGAHPRTTTSTYDAAGDLLSSTDARGKTTTLTYDAAGNVLTKTDPLNHVATFTYNSLNEVLTSKDALGKTATSTYNTAGDRLTSTSRGGVQRSWTYNTNGTVSTSTDGRGKVTGYGYNAAGLPTTVTDPDSRTVSVGYNTAGFVTSQKNAANETTNYTRDALGRQLTVTTPGNHTTTDTYDADGNLETVTDARGKVTTNHYDVADELTWTKDPLLHQTSYAYDGDGRLHTTTDASGKDTTRGYDAFGDLTSVTDPNQHTTHYGYDADSNRTSTTLPSGAESTATYDDAGQLASATDARGKTTSLERDANGQITKTTDPLGRVTSQSWTDDGQQNVTAQPDTSTIQQTYDANGALKTYANGDGLVTTYVYDDAGLPLSRTEPGTMATNYTYDSAGRLKTTTTPDGHVTTLSYNSDGLVSSSHSDVPGSTDVTYAYNEDGQRTGMQDVTGSSSYTYDDAGELTGTTNGANASVGYTYTPTGDVSKITYPGSKDVTYQYDDAGQMTSLTDWQNRTTSFAWTQDGQLHTQATPNGVTQSWTYNANGQPTDIAIAGSTTLADYGYSYNDAGELTADASSDPLGSNVTHQYTYDPLSQLAGVQGTGPSGPITATAGGQLTKTADGTTYAYNAAQQVTSSTPTAGPAVSFTYDGNGSRLSSTLAAVGATPASSTSYTYDRDGNLASVTLPGATTISYSADGDGLRQSRTKGSSSKAFLWDSENDLPLLLDDGDRSYLYGPSNSPIAQIDDSTGTVQYLHGDLLGSTRLITDSLGSATGTYRYSAFGVAEAHTGATSAVGYTGSWADPDTSLIYLRARDLDPVTGQFLQVDPAVDITRTPYTYVDNAPTWLTDPSGLCGSTPTPQVKCADPGFFNDVILDPRVHAVQQASFDTFEGLADALTFGLAGVAGDFLANNHCVVDRTGFAYAGGQGLSLLVPGAGIESAASKALSVGTLLKATEQEPAAAEVAETVLYQKLTANGEHLKYGVTDSPGTRYSKAKLAGGSLNILARGTRPDMLSLERALHETLPIGPEEGQAFYVQKQIQNGLRPPPYEW